MSVRTATGGQSAAGRLGMNREHRIMIRQEECVSIAPRHVLHLWIGLALILLEGERKGGEGGLETLVSGGRNGLR
jgi:hypothetical protein